MSFTNLGFTEPTPLDPATANIWGALLNTNFVLIDSAISGNLDLDVSASVDVDLTQASGAADQSRNARFVFFGVLTSDITIYFPAGRTIGFSVNNATTGNHTLTIACGATPTALGTVVIAPQGGNSPLYSDGTNISRTVDTVGLGAGSASGVIGDSRNARMTQAAAGVTGTFAADIVIVGTALGGTLYILSTYSQAVNLGTTGAGGMDTGAAPASGFVSLYAIYNPNTATASILACNATTSTATVYAGANMPAGYLASALLGIWPTNSSRQFVIGCIKSRNFYGPIVYCSAAFSATYVSISISSAVPPGATEFSGSMGNGGTSAAVALAADANGTGEKICVATGVGTAGIDGYDTATPFSGMPIITSQTTFGKAGTAHAIQFGVTGYTF